jgi:hypothetical protein
MALKKVIDEFAARLDYAGRTQQAISLFRVMANGDSYWPINVCIGTTMPGSICLKEP